MRKQVFISTYCTWTSFGSVLQSFALCSFLNQMGYDAKLIDYDCSDIIPENKQSLGRIVKNTLYYFQDKKSRNGTNQFIEKNIPRIDKVHRYSDLQKIVNSESVFLAGSDQIWHPDSCNPFFFLRFADGCKRISYAASMGKTEIPKEKYDDFSKFISDFDCISVREQDACLIVNRIVGGRAECNIDPTFLHDNMFWTRYEKEYPIKGKYLLLYPLYWDRKYNDDLKRISKERELQVVAISKSPNIYCTRRIADADIGQFLYLVHNAEAVVTSSFHGLALSLNYHKDVSVIVNPSMPSRVDSLITLFGLNEIKVQDKINLVPIDYGTFEKKRLVERNKSEKYLRLAIGE